MGILFTVRYGFNMCINIANKLPFHFKDYYVNVESKTL